jgi:hypothetical protein
MVGYPSHGHESQNYFSTKQHKVSKVSAGEAKSSPKSSKSSQQKQSRPLSQHNGQNLNQLMAQSPSGQKKSHASHGKHPLERQSSSPRTIPTKQSRQSPSSLRSSPSSTRSSPPRCTVSPSRSSPLFASSTQYQAPKPDSLPKPPVAWTSCQMSLNTGPACLPTADPTAHLKLLLNVRDITV